VRQAAIRPLAGLPVGVLVEPPATLLREDVLFIDLACAQNLGVTQDVTERIAAWLVPMSSARGAKFKPR
jgi:hypothetical protein